MDKTILVDNVSALGTVCRQKLSLCGTFPLRSFATYMILDNEHSRAQQRNISALVFVGSENKTFDAFYAGDSAYVLRLPAMDLGTHIIAVYSDAKQLPNSPFIFTVTLPECDKDSSKVSDLSGRCICPYTSTVSVAGTCVRYEVIISSVLLPVLLLCSTAAATYILRRNAEEERMWRILESDLIWPDALEILGSGASGVVYKASFRGTPVAVKHFSVAQASESENSGALINRNSQELVDLVTTDQTRVSQTHVVISPENEDLATLASVETKDMSSVHLEMLTRQTRRKSSSTLFSILYQHPFPRTSFSSQMLTKSSRMKGDVRKTIKFLVGVRHPYITTVMGGVVLHGKEICLVLELMDLGSLWDCLHNVLFPIEGELVLNFLQCIAKGMTFLHSAKTPIIHGDLKSGGCRSARKNSRIDVDWSRLALVDDPSVTCLHFTQPMCSSTRTS